MLAQTPLALAWDGILLDRLGKRNVLSIRTFSCPYLFFTDHWLLCDLPVNLAFAVLLAANTNFDLLGLGLSLLGFGVTPAMEAGLTDHVWSVEELAHSADVLAPQPQKRGPYKKRIST